LKAQENNVILKKETPKYDNSGPKKPAGNRPRLLKGGVTKTYRPPPPGTMPKPIPSKPTRSDPVSVTTGEVVTWATDFVLPGRMPITFDRAYSSALHSALDPALRQDSLLGPNWCCNWDARVLEKEGALPTFLPGDGRALPFEPSQSEWRENPAASWIRLRSSGYGYQVEDEQQRLLSFSKKLGHTWLLSSIEDRNGNTLRFVRDEQGALTAVQHSGGYKLKVRATTERLFDIALEEPNGALRALVRFKYDGAGRLNGIIDANGAVAYFEYEHGARLTRWVSRDRSWFTYKYDDKGRCIETGGQDGLYQYRYDYDEIRRTVRVTDSYGAVTTYNHDDQFQLVSIKDPLGGLTSTKWNKLGRKTSETDPARRRVRYKYDDAGNVVAAMDPAGKRTKFEHDAKGRVTAITNAAGTRLVRKFDERGNLIEAGLQGAKASRTEYDGRGNPTRITDPEGRVTSIECDPRGLPVRLTDSTGHATTYVWDAFGRIAEEKNALGEITKFQYDPAGNLLEVEFADGTALRWRYDAQRNPVQRIERDGGTFRFDYGPMDSLIGFTRPSGGYVRLVRDQENRVVRAENSGGERWTFNYDSCSRVVEETDFAGRRRSFEYDGSGLCVKQTESSGLSITVRRDRAGRVVSMVSGEGEETAFQYDDAGQLISAVAGKVAVHFEWDGNGQLLREVQDAGIVQSAYDSLGLRTARDLGSGKQEQWFYDPAGHVSRIGLGNGESFEFGRDPLGRETDRKMPGSAVLHQEYDALNRLTRQWAGVSSGSERTILGVVDRHYHYDVNDNPVEVEDRFRTKGRFSYDTDARLTEVAYEHGTTESFTWDVNGYLRLAGSLGPGGRLENSGSISYVYDADGRVIEKHKDGQIWRYRWSGGGRLKSLNTPNGEEWTYDYDAFSRRVRKTGPQGSTAYLWDGQVIAEEFHQGVGTDRWVFQPGTFRPLGKVDEKSGKAYMCVTDQSGTPREMVSTSGIVDWDAQLSAWGKVEKERARRTTCALRFQGQWFDKESGLHYNLFRYYDPETGQYLSPDPLGWNGGTRLYGYAQNPLSEVDPLGLYLVTPQPKPMPAGTSFLRWPDYISGSFGFPGFIPGLPGTLGWSVSVSIDHYGNVYFSGGGGAAISTPLSGSLSAHWIATLDRPSEKDLKNFLTGDSLSVSAGYIGGYQVTYSPHSGLKTPVSVGVGLFSPQVGVSYSGSPPNPTFQHTRLRW
jgi:RHS repeat-associated protein